MDYKENFNACKIRMGIAKEWLLDLRWIDHLHEEKRHSVAMVMRGKLTTLIKIDLLQATSTSYYVQLCKAGKTESAVQTTLCKMFSHICFGICRIRKQNESSTFFGVIYRACNRKQNGTFIGQLCSYRKFKAYKTFLHQRSCKTLCARSSEGLMPPETSARMSKDTLLARESLLRHVAVYHRINKNDSTLLGLLVSERHRLLAQERAELLPERRTSTHEVSDNKIYSISALLRSKLCGFDIGS